MSRITFAVFANQRMRLESEARARCRRGFIYYEKSLSPANQMESRDMDFLPSYLRSNCIMLHLIKTWAERLCSAKRHVGYTTDIWFRAVLFRRVAASKKATRFSHRMFSAIKENSSLFAKKQKRDTRHIHFLFKSARSEDEAKEPRCAVKIQRSEQKWVSQQQDVKKTILACDGRTHVY